MADHLKEAWNKMSEKESDFQGDLGYPHKTSQGPHGPDGMDDDTYKQHKLGRKQALNQVLKGLSPEARKEFDAKIEQLKAAKMAVENARLQLSTSKDDFIGFMKQYDPQFWHEDANNIIDKLK
jgi:hypothetical protein